MKKSLLGLLALALAVVGCQNYDDQFDDLNTKIAALSSEVSELIYNSEQCCCIKHKT